MPAASQRLELYDLEADHGEANNIAGDHPELVNELEALLIGERATETDFANTYHHWTGKDGASTAEADNWSDYKYANAGITYMTDAGAPQLAWVAQMVNAGKQPNTARGNADLEFLGLEIRGDNAKQSLVLGSGVNLTGRNEIRVGNRGTLTMDNGTVSSLRGIDILPGGTLDGSGKVDATIYNTGTVTVAGNNTPRVHISGDYHQSDAAALKLSLSNEDEPVCVVQGQARLDGVLSIVNARGFVPVPGRTYTVLTARRISGTFANHAVVTADGSRFNIDYSASAVTITLD